MAKRSLRQLCKLTALTSVTVLTLSARGYLQEPLATGQYVTPLVIEDAVQQYLKPGLAAYPDFVAGAHQASPALTQVIKQVNAHVGLVFSPDSNTLYAAGGADDAVYVYTRAGTGFTAGTPIA